MNIPKWKADIAVNIAANMVTSLVSWLLLALLSTVALLSQVAWNSSLGRYLFTLSVLFVLVLAALARIRPDAESFARMLTVGRLRGLWRGAALDHEIERQIRRLPDGGQGTIRIKATRAFGMFVNENNISHSKGFYHCIRGEAIKQKGLNIKLLMHVPCLQSNLLKERASFRGKSETEFLESWWKVYSEAMTLRGSGIHIEIRYYVEDNANWRYYLFSNNRESDDVLFFAQYSPDHCGAKWPMYKVLRGGQTLYALFEDRFDQIWETAWKAQDFLHNQIKDKSISCRQCKEGGSCWMFRKELAAKYGLM